MKGKTERLRSTTVTPANQNTGSIHKGQQNGKKNIRADKRAYLDSLVVGAEEAAHHGNMRAVYANTKLSGIFNKPYRPTKYKNGASIVE